MITFRKLLERAKTKQIAVHTPTKEQAKALLKALDEKRYEWSSGSKLTSYTNYEYYEENTCYDFGRKKEVCYSPVVWYQKEGYKIIEFSDIDFEEK